MHYNISPVHVPVIHRRFEHRPTIACRIDVVLICIFFFFFYEDRPFSYLHPTRATPVEKKKAGTTFKDWVLLLGSFCAPHPFRGIPVGLRPLAGVNRGASLIHFAAYPRSHVILNFCLLNPYICHNP
jgi:hypothetical protein